MKKRMLQFIKSNWLSISTLLAITVVTTVLLIIVIPPAKPLLSISKAQKESASDMEVKVEAIGDSLTEGVGDVNNEGGYVPLLAKDLTEVYHFASIEMYNHGKSGNKTTQVTKRIENSEEIQSDIASANMIVITIGANDLMKTVKANIFKDLSIDTFDSPKEEYKSNIATMYKTIRKYNKDCPIYQLGIYNPYYLNFKEITEMQDIVDMWNVTTEEFVQSQNNAYFIPINDQIYKGNGVTTDTAELNNLLSEEDSFHPNNTGYQIIANAFRDKIVETQASLILEK